MGTDETNYNVMETTIIALINNIIFFLLILWIIYIQLFDQLKKY